VTLHPRPRPLGARLHILALSAVLLWYPATVTAQAAPTDALPAPEALDEADAPGGWNDARTLRLVERARTQRQSLVVDSTMRSYRADARGYVYFFMDRTDQELRSLVKADQIALEVMWQAPRQTRQHIVGLRDQMMLPTNIRYHLDHLTVVQDDFGDNIRMGDGDEVEEVLHPAAPGSEYMYDFLLADSLTLVFPGGSDVRVFEIRVRPKRMDRPGFVGSVFLDQATAAIVRMNFSFTPASYVDPYVDYIRVALDNSLWMGKHWLPYRQEMEIRREVPLLDFLAGSVIRGRFEIRNYDFNVDFPPLTFLGRPVTSESIARREAFPFERGLLDDLDEQGLGPTPALAEVEARVREVVEDRYLTGLAPLRFHLAALSEGFRHNRAEGLYLGAGASLRPTDALRLRAGAGYAFQRAEPSASLQLETSRGNAVTPTVAVYWNQLRDIGGHPGAPPLENTIASLSGKVDYLDPYFARGAALSLRRGRHFGGPELTLRWEEHHAARDVLSKDTADTEYRPVRGIDEGTLTGATLRLPVALPLRTGGTVTATGARLAEQTYATINGEITREYRLPSDAAHGLLSLAGGWVSGEAPAQALYLLGGRTTLPGHGYRDFVGDRYWLLRGEATVPVRSPWVGVRFIGALGATYLEPRTLPSFWTPTDSDGVRASVGAGLSIAYDIMRIDLARGLGAGGGWEAVFSVSPGLRPWI